MHPAEIESVLRGITVLVDTREQETPSLRRRLKETGFPFKRQKLEFGDYSATVLLPNEKQKDFSSEFAVERKMSLDELCQCYCRGRDRFRREFERAKKSGAKLYLLIENGSFEKILSGRYRSRMNREALLSSLFAWLARYDCQILFCNAEHSGRILREILYREVKERLEAM